MKAGDVATLGQHRLVCGDAAEAVPALWPVFDAVVTDPPYGIGFKYNLYRDEADGYGPWLWGIIEEAESKCLPGSPVFVWQAMLNVRHYADWFPRDWRIFAGAKNFVQMRKTLPMQYAFDPVVVWWTEGKHWTAGTANRDFHLADTNPSTRKRGTASYVEGHPCPRPLGQVEHVLSQWVRPGGLVLDCFAGSGTTMIAAENTGRRCVAIEIDPGYCQVIIDRWEKLTGQRAIVSEEEIAA